MAQSGRNDDKILYKNDNLFWDLINPKLTAKEKKKAVMDKFVKPFTKKNKTAKHWLNDKFIKTLAEIEWQPEEFERGKANKGIGGSAFLKQTVQANLKLKAMHRDRDASDSVTMEDLRKLKADLGKIPANKHDLKEYIS